MRRTLAAALLIGGQYSRAAQLFEQAGAAYRQHLGAGDPWALDCAYQAGHAYAQAGKPDKALPQLRYYVSRAAATRRRLRSGVGAGPQPRQASRPPSVLVALTTKTDEESWLAAPFDCGFGEYSAMLFSISGRGMPRRALSPRQTGTRQAYSAARPQVPNYWVTLHPL